MPLEPVKVPQNVYVEDRIIGPITLRHLVILGIGAGISYAIWAFYTSSGNSNVIIQGICWTPLVIAAGFAFVRVNDISLFRLILLMIEGASKPNTRYWAPHVGLSINLITKQTAKELPEEEAKATHQSSKLQALAEQLETERREIAEEDTEFLMQEQVTGSPRPTMPRAPVNKERIRADSPRGTSTIDGISAAPPAQR